MTPVATLLALATEAVAAVTDPELPCVTIAELGILEEVRAGDAFGVVEVDLVPTFLGCPALALIQADVAAAAGAVPGVSSVVVRFLSTPPWSPERITAAGRAKLAADMAIAGADPLAARPVVCPMCCSVEVESRSMFGPTACRSVSWCADCRNPVEVIRQ